MIMEEFTRDKIDLIGEWEDIRGYLGDEQMLDDLLQYFTNTELVKFISYFNKEYDLFETREE